MSTSPKQFLAALVGLKITHLERAIALLWWYGVQDEESAITVKQLCNDIENAGYAKPHSTRLGVALRKDKRTVKGQGGVLKIKISARSDFDKKYLPFVKVRPVPESDSILPIDLFANTRGYIEKVVKQINASYDIGLYDCCAVMCRRLLETLIIETYETKKLAKKIQGDDGNFLMFSGLLKKIENEQRFNIGRNALTSLKAFKRLGDLSAHNRQFNARKPDIDRIRDGLRVASETLLHEAKLIK